MRLYTKIAASGNRESASIPSFMPSWSMRGEEDSANIPWDICGEDEYANCKLLAVVPRSI